jgi:hypothetical protein
MFHRVRGRWAKARFNRLTREILNTPPIRVVSAPWAMKGRDVVGGLIAAERA